jgi:hypothetical protein
MFENISGPFLQFSLYIYSGHFPSHFRFFKSSVSQKLVTKRSGPRYSYLMSATRRHPGTGKMVWCNQSSVSHGSYYLHLPRPTVQAQPWPHAVQCSAVCLQDVRLAPSHTTHADGRELEPEQLEVIRRAQWEASRAHAWRKGDLLVLDNTAVGGGWRVESAASLCRWDMDGWDTRPRSRAGWSWRSHIEERAESGPGHCPGGKSLTKPYVPLVQGCRLRYTPHLVG